MDTEIATVFDLPEAEQQGYYDTYPAKMKLDRAISDGAYRFYGFLVNYTRRTGFAWARNEHLCRQAGITERTLQGYLKQLEGGAYIVRDTDENGRRRIWLYEAYCKEHMTPAEICGGGKSLRGAPADPCGDTSNNKNINNTPYDPPEGDAHAKKAKLSAERREELEQWWEIFWKEYPKKVDKRDAHAVFLRLAPDRALMTAIWYALKRQKRSVQWQDPQYIPSPRKWLRGELWNNQVEPAAPASDTGQVVHEQEVVYW